MPTFQLPPLADEYMFEEFTCDLFNSIEKTNSFILFGKKGQSQKGIDVISSEKRTAIQCKKKDLSRGKNTLKNELLNDIRESIELSQDLKIEFDRFIFVSTYSDDVDIVEFCNEIKNEFNTKYDITYWGWNTITRHTEHNKQ